MILNDVDKPAVPVLLGMTFVGRVIMSVHSAESKIVPYHSAPVSMLMVYEAEFKVETYVPYIRQIYDLESVMSVVFISCKQKYVTIALQIVLKAICETSVLVSIQATGLIIILCHDIVSNTHA